MSADNPYRELPPVDALAADIGGGLPRSILVELARAGLELARERIREGDSVDVRTLASELADRVRRTVDTPVINATGVVLHTNLGRSPWSSQAVIRAGEAASGYSNLEIDLASGQRRRRGGYVTRLLRALTGAEDALVVNNNASALLLSLATLAGNGAIAVSRGELIEIGGSYRLPEVIGASGARLVEVGTTNHTRIDDYVTAVQVERCTALLKVHPSNYQVSGFTSEAGLTELSDLARHHQIHLLFDIGSGLLDADMPWLGRPPPAWAQGEPGARQAVDAGADVVMFSGDKMLGGPQAGILIGSQGALDEMRAHPLARALRVDGVTYAALAATLEAYADGRVEDIPFWAMALADYGALERRAKALADQVKGEVAPGHSAVGGGSVPGTGIESPLVRLPSSGGLYEALLANRPPIVARREEGALLIDLRTVPAQADSELASAIARCR